MFPKYVYMMFIYKYAYCMYYSYSTVYCIYYILYITIFFFQLFLLIEQSTYACKRDEKSHFMQKVNMGYERGRQLKTRSLN